MPSECVWVTKPHNEGRVYSSSLALSWNLREGSHTVLGKTSLQVFWAHMAPGPTSSMCDGCDVLHRKGNCQLCFCGNSYGSEHTCCIPAQLSLSPDLQWMKQIHDVLASFISEILSFKGHFMRHCDWGNPEMPHSRFPTLTPSFFQGENPE